MRLIKWLFLPLSIVCCSFTHNEPLVKAGGLAIEKITNEDIYLRGYVYANQDLENYPYYYSFYRQSEDEESVFVWGEYCINAKAGYTSSTYVVTVSLSFLKGNNQFIFKVQTNDGESECTINYITKGKDEVIVFSELDNNKGVKNSYLVESKDPIRPEYNYIHQDQIIFSNFEDLWINEFYYDLDISRFRFKYHNGNDNILNVDAKLAIYDRYNNFPNFPIGENMYRYLNLDVNHDENNECYFKFKDPIYFDPLTHISSLNPESDYLISNSLLLPKNKEKELAYLPCYIELNIHSYVDYKLIGYFDLSYIKKYMGDCSDSEFCTNSIYEEEHNIREKVIEINI